MKFYVATRFSNRVGVERVRRVLNPLGHTITYDWTKHLTGPHTELGMGAISVYEIEGVREADFVVVILRGGYGTHTEMGAALALNKPVILVAGHDNMLYDTHRKIIPFYFHPLIHRAPDISSLPAIVQSLYGEACQARFS